MKIKAAVVHEKGQPFQIEEVDLDPPKAGEVLVKIVASGVCHRDEVAQLQFIPVPLLDLALAGPLGCGVQSGAGTVLNRLRPKFGSSIAVFGCGTLGMRHQWRFGFSEKSTGICSGHGYSRSTGNNR